MAGLDFKEYVEAFEELPGVFVRRAKVLSENAGAEELYLVAQAINLFSNSELFKSIGLHLTKKRSLENGKEKGV